MLIFPLTANAADTIGVCGNCALRTIADAVLAAKPGDTVVVQAGTYPTANLAITKPIELRGEGNPVIDGQGKGDIFLIHADHVKISGFTIQNSGFSYVDDLAAIKIEDSGDCRIAGNRLLGNFFAIHLAHSHDCTIENNEIEGPQGRDESSAGNGIHIWYGQRMQIQGNHVTGHRDGIYFEFVTDSRIADNKSERNLRYGLHFMFSDRNEYVGNSFVKNGSGVAVMYSKNIKMVANRFEGSWGGAAYGVLLKEIAASEIEKNHFTGNTVGTFFEGTTRSRIEMNEFRDNGWAMRVLGNSDGNTFTHNNYIANTFDISTNAGSNQNTITENYWSGYTGLDLNDDGFGDIPYRPVHLSSVLMEKFGVSVLLIKSFFFTVADEAESALPVLTPETFKDTHPLMKKVAGI